MVLMTLVHWEIQSVLKVSDGCVIVCFAIAVYVSISIWIDMEAIIFPIHASMRRCESKKMAAFNILCAGSPVQNVAKSNADG